MENERQLVEALRQGSHPAFQMLYERYRSRIFYFLYGLTRTQADAEELFQSVFLKIWEHRASLDPRQSFSGYAYTIARNHAYNHIKKRLFGGSIEESIVANLKAGTNLENKLIDEDLSRYIDGLIDRLPERRREIFLLHFRQQKSYAEITGMLGISENTIDTQIRRALTYLRGQVEREFTALAFLIAMTQPWSV